MRLAVAVGLNIALRRILQNQAGALSCINDFDDLAARAQVIERSSDGGIELLSMHAVILPVSSKT